MIREQIGRRPNWEATVESQGLIYHHTQGGVYWDESVCYRFTAAEVDRMEAATNELQRLCLEAGQAILDRNWLDRLAIPKFASDAIRWAWDAEPPALYGRMDLAFDGTSEPKLLEYNADTPTGLLEAAVVQWYWLKDQYPDADQFNSIHERLIEKWRDLAPYVSQTVHFAAMEDVQAEDAMTVTYLRETAAQAGLGTKSLLIKDIGWDGASFVDLETQPMLSIFKLYPWEWLIHEEFGVRALETYRSTQWIEPIWKMLWSNKALLAILWELFPNHPNLLPAYLDGPRDLKTYATKPLLSREGANVTLQLDGAQVKTDGDYGAEGFVYQAIGPIPRMDGGHWPIIGSWLVDGVACGVGVRESDAMITNNMSRFVPHLFR